MKISYLVSSTGGHCSLQWLFVQILLLISFFIPEIICFIARLAKTCVIRITSTKIFFVANDHGTSSASLWADLEKGNFFDEFAMEGVTAEDNEICLEVVPGEVQ